MALNFLTSHWGENKNMKIGLLGGSFNPAHKGHIYISEMALKKMNLDEVWWLVSPQNPLKSSQGMASFEQRYDYAKKIITNSKIKVSNIEQELGTRYTVDTISRLKQIYKSYKFVWIMGADNLEQIPKWKNWKKIFNLVPIAVFDRNQYSLRIKFLKAAKTFKKQKIEGAKLFRLCYFKAPAWGFFRIKNNPLSSTDIRKNNFHY
ncbi:MAG: nicotinate-nucleotide adenylyltransferase [Alphaproteobacteria bacterium]